MSEDWPYDADRDDPLTALRIPVATSHTRWNYIVAFDRDSAERPDEAETAMLASYLAQYMDHWYNDRWKARLRERPFDIDGGANGVTFHKYGPGDWGYRRRTWCRGPRFVPSWDRKASSTLLQVMDRSLTFVEGDPPFAHWLEWKAAHPDVFEVTP